MPGIDRLILRLLIVFLGVLDFMSLPVRVSPESSCYGTAKVWGEVSLFRAIICSLFGEWCYKIMYYLARSMAVTPFNNLVMNANISVFNLFR